MTVTFEGYERRADKINKCLADNGIASLEDALKLCTDKGFNPREIVHDTQSIAFQNAEWAYTLGCALAIKRGADLTDKAAAARGDVAAAVKDNPALVAMMERAMQRMTVEGMLKQAGADAESIKQLNRVLQGIKKDV